MPVFSTSLKFGLPNYSGPPISKLLAPIIPPVETNADRIARVTRVAKAKLKKSNRKKLKHNITIPLNIQVEAGTVYTLKGFVAGQDGPWLVVSATHDLGGKQGATTKLELETCITAF